MAGKPRREKEVDVPALIPALVVGAATAGGAAISAGASNHAANVAASTAAANNALQEKIYNQNKGLEQPYIGAGNTAQDALSGFLGLGGDPAKTQKAFNDYLDSTGYQFDKQQGIDTVNQSQAAAGLLKSGSTLKALQDRGTALADTFGQEYVGNLNTIANRGANSANALAGTGTSYANAVSSNNNNAATVAGNAAISGAAQTNGAIQNALNAFSLTRGASSFGGGGASSGGNAFNQPGYAPFAYTG